MRPISEIAKEIELKRKQAGEEIRSNAVKNTKDNTLYDMIATLGDYLVESLKTDNKREIVNLPQIQKIIGQVKEGNSDQIKSLLALILSSIKQVKFPDKYNVEGEVTVKNQISIPDVKFPDPVKTVGVNALPGYVKENLEKIAKKELSVNVEAPVVNLTETKVEIDLSVLEELIRTNNELLKKLDKPEQEIDLSGVIQSNDAVRDAIESIRFPVPNFQSSWQHSLDMQAKDLPTVYGYTSEDPNNPDYIEISTQSGETYRKTFTYGTVGGTKVVVAKSAWIKQ